MSSSIPQITFKITKTKIIGKPLRLKAKWTAKMDEDLRQMHILDFWKQLRVNMKWNRDLHENTVL